MRPATLDATKMSRVRPRCLLREDPGPNIDACRTQSLQTSAAYPRIWVGHRCDDAAYTRRDDRIGAGPRPALMRAWLKRDIDRRTPCALSCCKCYRLAVRPASARGAAAGNHHIILHQD